jgi:uncharacterized membrane protein
MLAEVIYICPFFVLFLGLAGHFAEKILHKILQWWLKAQTRVRLLMSDCYGLNYDYVFSIFIIVPLFCLLPIRK